MSITLSSFKFIFLLKWDRICQTLLVISTCLFFLNLPDWYMLKLQKLLWRIVEVQSSLDVNFLKLFFKFYFLIKTWVSDSYGFLKKKNQQTNKQKRMHVWAGKSACLVSPNAESSIRKFQPAISEFKNSTYSGWGSNHILFSHSYNKIYVLSHF